MQFLRLTFVKKAPTFQLTFPFLIPVPDIYKPKMVLERETTRMFLNS